MIIGRAGASPPSRATGLIFLYITQYSSTVYIGIKYCHGCSSIIRKFSVFTFSFKLLMTSRWRTCQKITACKKLYENIAQGTKYRKNMIFTDSSSSFETQISLTIAPMNLKFCM